MSLKEKLRAISLDLPNLIESINQIEESSGDNNNKFNSIENSLETVFDGLKDLIKELEVEKNTTTQLPNTKNNWHRASMINFFEDESEHDKLYDNYLVNKKNINV